MEAERGRVERVLPGHGRVELEVHRAGLLRVLREDALRARDVERVVQRPAMHRDRAVWARLCGRDGARVGVSTRAVRDAARDAPSVISAGRFSTIVVVPALTETECRPFEGETASACAPFTEMVPFATQLGVRTRYVNAPAASIVVVRVSLNGYRLGKRS